MSLKGLNLDFGLRFKDKRVAEVPEEKQPNNGGKSEKVVMEKNQKQSPPPADQCRGKDKSSDIHQKSPQKAKYKRLSPCTHLLQDVDNSKQTPPQSTQLPQPEASVPPQAIPTIPDEPPPAPVPSNYQRPPQEPLVESPAPLQSESDKAGDYIKPEESVVPSSVFEPSESPTTQTQEKRYTVEEIAPSTQTPEANAPEAYAPDISPPPTTPMPKPESVTTGQKFDEPLSSFDTPTSLPQSKIQPSSAGVPEVTVIPQEKKGGSTLKKVSLFLLIVFIMVNIVLIGFYIFVSRQL